MKIELETNKKAKYDEDSIQVFKGLSGIRRRPTMYLGELGNPAILQLLREVVENSVDESMIGENTSISVKVEGNKTPQTFLVADRGRGIPVKKHKKTRKSTLTTIMTTLHAGGKFDEKSYKVSIGVHGLGVSCTVALSKLFEVWTHREGNWFYQKFKKGKPKGEVCKTEFPKKLVGELGAIRKRGTIIRFVPDYTILGKKAKVTDRKLQSWLQDVSNLNKGLQVRLVTDKIDETYRNKGGAKEYLKKIIEQKKVEVLGKPFILEDDTCTVAIQWSDFEGEDGVLSYVNGGSTEEGGTHVQGLNTVIAKAFRSISKKVNCTLSDLRYGVIGFIDIKLHSAEFDSQTKNKLVTSAVKKQVAEHLFLPFKKFLKINKRTTTLIIKRAGEIRRARDEARKIQRAASKIRGGSKILLPGKLTTASSKTLPEKKELFIVEGDSAGGGAKKARDKIFQEVLAMKGKGINAAKQNLTKVLMNTEVQNILISMGVNPNTLKGKSRAKNSFRVGRIIIFSDADFDGFHITQLLLTLLYIIVPEVYDRRMVYVIDSPLYVANPKGSKVYGYTLKEIQEKIKGRKTPITRMKGLGEASWQDLKEFAFNIVTRKMFRVTPVKGKGKTRFMKIVGEDTLTRKKLLGIV